jgi:hypothetical protein
MHKFTYTPEFGAEYTPVKSVEFQVDDEVTWADLLPVFLNYLRSATFSIPNTWELRMWDTDKDEEVELKRSYGYF